MLIRSSAVHPYHRATATATPSVGPAVRPVRHWFLIQLSLSVVAWAVIAYGVNQVL
jgi:hypothetical protein